MKERNKINPRDMPKKKISKNSKFKDSVNKLNKDTDFKENEKSFYKNEFNEKDNILYKKDDSGHENLTENTTLIDEMKPDLNKKRQRKIAEKIFEESKPESEKKEMEDKSNEIEKSSDDISLEYKPKISEDKNQSYIENIYEKETTQYLTENHIPSVEQEHSFPVFSLPKISLNSFGKDKENKLKHREIPFSSNQENKSYSKDLKTQDTKSSIHKKQSAKVFKNIYEISSSIETNVNSSDKETEKFEDKINEDIEKNSNFNEPINNIKASNIIYENEEKIKSDTDSKRKTVRTKSLRQDKFETDNSINSFKKKRVQNYNREDKNSKEDVHEIYDPLEKDLDNDGVKDRYDMDFKDSNITYRYSDLSENKFLKSQSDDNKKFTENFAVNKPLKVKKEIGLKFDKDSGGKLNNSSSNKKSRNKTNENPYEKSKEQEIEDKVLSSEKLKNEETNEFSDVKNFTERKSNFESAEKFTRTKNNRDKVKVDNVGNLKKRSDKSHNKSEAFQENKAKTTNDGIHKYKKDKFYKEEKKISKLHDKKDKKKKLLLKQEKNSKNKVQSPLIVASSAAANYLYSGKEDNAGVDAAYKSSRAIEMGLRKVRQNNKKKPFKTKKQLSKIEKKIHKKEEKLLFKRNFEELKKKEDYKKTNYLNRFFMKKRFKKEFKNRNRQKLTEKIKHWVTGANRKVADFIKRGGYKKLALCLAVVGIFIFLMQIGSNMLSLTTGLAGNVATTTYLSEETTLNDVNNEFLSYENTLQDEIDNLKSYHPGYDEYHVKGDSVGHDIHELFSYLTARYGEIKSVGEIQGELKKLFNQKYDKKYTSKSVTKYDSEGNPYIYRILTLTVTKKSIDEIAREEFENYETNMAHYLALLENQGNMSASFGSGYGDLSEIIDNPNFSNPGIAFDDASVKALFNEAEKHIGKKYVFGASGPKNFDCSGFVCWSYTHSGVKNMPRTTAWLIYKNYCNPISPSEAKAGDIIFFKGTYNSGTPISHVGIYAGNGMMLHAGDPIQFASINSNYWKNHFYAFGRPK